MTGFLQELGGHCKDLENNAKSDDFNTFRKLRKEATIMVLWENLPKKEGPYCKREMDTIRLQKSYIHYKVY